MYKTPGFLTATSLFLLLRAKNAAFIQIVVAIVNQILSFAVALRVKSVFLTSKLLIHTIPIHS
jgi:hypothetical protein